MKVLSQISIDHRVSRWSVCVDQGEGEAWALEKGLFSRQFEARNRALNELDHACVAPMRRVQGERSEWRVDLVPPGPSLAQVQVDLEVAEGLLEEITRTVVDLHRAGVIHGQLGPEHVRLMRDGSWMLCGFDPLLVSRDDEALAPEVRWGAEHSPAADVYGLGRIVHHLLPAEHRLMALAESMLGPVEGRPTAAEALRLLRPVHRMPVADHKAHVVAAVATGVLLASVGVVTLVMMI